jgi:hypothetical protein
LSTNYQQETIEKISKKLQDEKVTTGIIVDCSHGNSQKEYNRQWKSENKEKRKQQDKIWREENKERVIKYREEYRLKNREQILEKNRVKILHRIAKEAQEALGEGRRDEGNDVGKRDAAASIPMRHVLSIVPSNILHGDMVGGASTKAKRASPSASSILNKEIAAYKKAERDWQASKENEKQILRQIDKMYSRDEGSDTQGSGVDDAVTASLDTLSSLDPLVERYFLNGQVTFDEINEIGVKIDEEMINEMVAAGASHEDIQHYKSVITAQPPSTSTCIYQNMHKLFQLSYNKPVDNSNQELQDLRAYHKDVLTKTARIMEPFAPYRIKLKE